MIDYSLTLISIALCFGTAAMAFNVIFGHLGAFHLGGGILFGVGAYTYAQSCHINPWVSLAAAIALGGFVSCLMTAPFLHLTQHASFLFVTLAFQLLFFEVCNNARGITNGAAGIAAVQPLVPADPGADTNWPSFAATVVVFIVAGLVYARFGSGQLVQIVGFLRQNEWTAAELGFMPGFYKLLALAVGGAGVALSGALYVSVVGFVSPRDAGLDISIAILVAVMAVPRSSPWIVAGVGAGLYVLPDLAQFFGSGSGVIVPAIRTIVFGSVFVAIGLMSDGSAPAIKHKTAR